MGEFRCSCGRAFSTKRERDDHAQTHREPMSDPQRPEREAIEQAIKGLPCYDSDELQDAPGYFLKKSDVLEMLAAMTPTPTPGWRDISTAPKDGTFILIYPSSCWVEDVEHDYEVSYWDEDFGRWHFSALPDDYTGPTHWQPLPPAPTGDRS
jgi:hypothetical protein